MGEQVTIPSEANPDDITERELSPYEQMLGMATDLTTDVIADYPEADVVSSIVLKRTDGVKLQVTRLPGLASITVHEAPLPGTKGGSTVNVSQYYAEFFVAENGDLKPTSITVQRPGGDQTHEDVTAQDLDRFRGVAQSYRDEQEKVKWLRSDEHSPAKL